MNERLGRCVGRAVQRFNLAAVARRKSERGNLRRGFLNLWQLASARLRNFNQGFDADQASLVVLKPGGRFLPPRHEGVHSLAQEYDVPQGIIANPTHTQPHTHQRGKSLKLKGHSFSIFPTRISLTSQRPRTRASFMSEKECAPTTLVSTSIHRHSK